MTPQQIEVELYEVKYKGSLFCTTAGCEARIVYVHQAASVRYFRTWKYDNHSDNCIHRFERERSKTGSENVEIIYVQASQGKKGKALDEAYRQATQSRAYEGLFHHAHRFFSEHPNVIFTGIGEVKLRMEGEYELFIYEGRDFKLQNT